MALLLKSVTAAGANVPLNPEDFVKHLARINANEILAEIHQENISFEQWKRVDCEDGKKRMKIVQTTITN